MEAWKRQLITAILGAAITAGCDGGQTGQPSSGHFSCPLDAGMLTPNFPHLFEGQHRATLDWQSSPPDELVVSISRGEASPAALGCGFEVVEIVEVATLGLGSLDSGRATLTVLDGHAAQALLSFRGKVVNLSAAIDLSNGASALSGTIEVARDNQPSDLGYFPPR